jgi:hypothetical protein
MKKEAEKAVKRAEKEKKALSMASVAGGSRTEDETIRSWQPLPRITIT